MNYAFLGGTFSGTLKNLLSMKTKKQYLIRSE